MKKTYSTPLIETISYQSEGLMANSLPIGTTPGSSMGSPQKEWEDDEWTYEE
ncbi:MAG: hypothetical protein Q4D66_07165 [Bacteroidales bacterium]|nr:hypothetical protein [Bacteroidales bacterium]